MEIVTTKKKLPKNCLLLTRLKRSVLFDRIKITCSNYYSVFVSHRLVDFGPIRTSKGFARVKESRLDQSEADILVSILYYGFQSFDIEFQDFFFGIELFLGNEKVADSSDFVLEIDNRYLSDSVKYSFQRGLVERYDFSLPCKPVSLDVKDTERNLLEDVLSENRYEPLALSLLSSKAFSGFECVYPRPYLEYESLSDLNRIDLQKEFFGVLAVGGYFSRLYELENVRTGLIKIRIISKNPRKTRAFICFDEVLENEKMSFGRSNCNDLICLFFGEGSLEYVSKVPYCLHYLNVLLPEGEYEVNAEFIPIENEAFIAIPGIEDLGLKKMYEASVRSFRENSFDLFTDCPGRERAPWICDSYFMGIAERYLTNSNVIEKRFLVNYLHQDCEDIPEDVFAMCYPSDHKDGTFIPNWGMWLVLEINAYRKRNGDDELAALFKDRIYRFYRYLSTFENEHGLLENLPSWVFVEWSKANDFVSGVNFPTNMLYWAMLRNIAEMYEDRDLLGKSVHLAETINRLSYNGEFYFDHAIRGKGGELRIVEGDISESAQHYAIFLGLRNDSGFKERVLHSEERGLAPSAVFIGMVLKLMWMAEDGRVEDVKRILKGVFLPMAETTGTLWEKNAATASCNHGFTSVIGPIIGSITKK